MRNIVISLGRSSNFADISKTLDVSWEKFAAFLTKEPPVTKDKTSVGWYCPAEFKPAYRDGKNLVARHCLTFDYDDLEPDDVDDIRLTYAEYANALYTTASHTKEAPRIRVVFPLSRPCNIEEFGCVTRTVASWYDIEKLARESDKPAQMMFRPSKRPDGEFRRSINVGKWINVDEILEDYDDWRDRKSWPVRKQGDFAHGGDATPLPDTKHGIVGDFCREFRVPDAITRFDLPYTSGSTEERYTFTRGSRPDGLRLYDDGLKAHSDHNTDPAHGQHNSFDLVRLHRFGGLDTESDRGLAITEQPSHKAMVKFARSLPEMQDQFENLDSAVIDYGDIEQRSPDFKRFKLWSLQDLKRLPPPEWIIKGVMPKAELAVIYGEPGSGKSFLTYDMACAVMREMAWGNVEAKVKRGRAIYIFAEGAAGARYRGEAYCIEHGDGLTPLVIKDRPNMFDASDTVLLVNAIVNQGGADLVVIDTLNAASPGADENSGKDMTKVLDHCRLINKHTGAMVVLVHHSGKDASKGARGWSGLKAAADVEIEIRRNGDFRTAVVTKMKDGLDGVQHTFKLKIVVLSIDEDGDEVTSCVVEHVDSAPVETERPGPGGMYGKATLRVAKTMMCDGHAMTMDELIDETVAKIPAPEKDKRDTRRQQIQRAVQKLVVDRHLFLDDKGMIAVTTATPQEDWDDE